jgi:diphthamide biosynthesis methyltransferase
MPKWQENYKPKSFVDSIKDNKKIKAHTLILVDLGLTFPEALRQLGRACRKKIKLGKIIVCSQLGTKEGRIYYSSLDELFGAEVFPPFCFILPSDLHFLEKEFLEKVKEKI